MEDTTNNTNNVPAQVQAFLDLISKKHSIQKELQQAVREGCSRIQAELYRNQLQRATEDITRAERVREARRLLGDAYVPGQRLTTPAKEANRAKRLARVEEGKRLAAVKKQQQASQGRGAH